jgi:hypothetical protein
MRFSTITATLASAALAAARINGIEAPSTLAPGKPFALTLLTENYIQSVADIAVAWGFSLAPGYPGALGSFITSEYLGPANSNTLKNITLTVTAPEGLAGEAYAGKDLLLSAAVYSLYGASSGPIVQAFNVTVKAGENTEGLVRSEGIAWTMNKVE